MIKHKAAVYLLFLFICFSILGYSQNEINNNINHNHLKVAGGVDEEGKVIDPFHRQYIFDADSISGFNEEAAVREAKLYFKKDWEIGRYVAVLKRNFIDFKYGFSSLAPLPTPQAPCTNPDFETGSLAGWVRSEGPNNDSQTMAGCCPTSPSGQIVVVTPGNDPNLGATLPRVPPGGGNFAARLGPTGAGDGGTSYRLSQQFNVTAANSVFIYRYAAVLNAAPHDCNEQPFFNITFRDCSNNPIPCGQFQEVAQSSACSAGNTSYLTSGSWKYLPWQTRSFDLTAYIGQCVEIEFTVAGCVASQGAHGGYAYVDASCQPMTLNLNGFDIPVGQTNSFICASGTNTLCAPDGFTGYSWTGPGVVTGQTTRCVSANTSGTYSVTLGMAGTSCNSPVLYSNFSIVPKPIADFNFTVTPCQSTFTVPFTDNSGLNGGPAISSYVWDWGDGTVNGSNANETHTYASTGTRTVELKISNGGCVDSISKVVTVSAGPLADFNLQGGCIGTAASFTSISTPSASIASQVWTWGDATPNGSGANLTHSYTNPGTYNVKLVVTEAGLCKDSITKPITIHPKPNLAFSPNAVCLGSTTDFNNTSNISAPGSISAWAWDIDNNGSTDNTTQSPSLTFTATGTFSVELKATSDQGCSDSLVRAVRVYAIPTASFTANTVCLGTPTNFSDASNGNGSNVNIFQWDFSNDGSVDVTGIPNPNHTFANFGVNLVSYTVATTPTLGLVCSNSINTLTVYVNPQPTANFTHVNKCVNDQPINFDASSSTIGAGNISTYSWAYGNGINNTGVTTSYSYPLAGTYSVTLLVTSDNGCQSTIIRPVTVFPKPIMAIVNSQACDGKPITFNANSQANSGNVTSWNWDFNSSISSFEAQGQTVSYTFPSAGDHTLNLVSITDNGCRDTISMPFYVDYVPVPQFSINKPSGCPIHCVVFSDLTPPITGPGQNAEWKWYLGDGTVVTSTSNGTQSHCYNNSSHTQPATFDVKLVVTTDRGCKDSLTKASFVTVFPVPIAAYNASPNPADIVEPLVHFNNLSSDYTKWWWSFGDGPLIDSVNVSPYHEYSDVTANTYNTNLIVQNQYGCRDTAYLKVEITPEFSFYIPNAFTPNNGDGVNDYFSGIGIGIEKYEMWIFDRWGEMIFYTDDIKKGWNGKVQGKTQECKQDVYVWKVKLKDVLGKKHDYIGHVTLLR
jgi:gliding motility-associated-like protein